MSALDGATFDRHRRELHVHCYRMLANYHEAEDAVQETYARAWRARDRLEESSNARAWLYKIATNVCVDRARQARTRARSFAEVSWLEPYPDRLLDLAAPPDEQPDAVLAARETIELAFLAVIQLLPARQRAVLVLRDVLEWSAAETAVALEMTVPAVTSALQRARARIAAASAGADRTTQPSPYERELLQKFIDSHERMDAAAALAAAREDIRITMPPNPMYFSGREQMRGLFDVAREMGEWRLVPAPANRMPCAASYLRAPGDTLFRAHKLDVLRIDTDRIAEVTTFGPELFAEFGLEPVLEPIA